MIGTFWNICRACPSMPIDKLHSEYRSTYRWYEYTGPKQEIVRQAPQTLFTGQVQEPAFPRRKKHPELAYKTHKILTDSEPDTLLEKTYFYERARSEERWAASQEKNSRRSKSEGPPAGKATYRLIYTKPIYSVIPNRSPKNKKRFFNDENEAPKCAPGYVIRNNVIQHEPVKHSPKKEVPDKTGNVLHTRLDDLYSQSLPKKSYSMNGIKNKDSNLQESVPVHKRGSGLKNKCDVEVLQGRPNVDSENNPEDSIQKNDDRDAEFKSEYKKNFQPFNRYEYDENKGVFEKKPVLVNAHNNQSEIESPSSSWYKEVMQLRQKANQYRHRGWGTELVPDHIAQLYNDQMMLWEQVSRRSTLSALSLASSVISRDGSPNKEERENRKNSPMKIIARAKSVKVSTATHQGKSAEKKIAKTVASKNQTETSPKKGNNQVKKLGIKRTSPSRPGRESAVGIPPTIHRALSQGLEKPKRRPRPTSLLASVPSGPKTVQPKKKDKSDGEVDDFPNIDEEKIVKSPPEPTRVKSPDQIVIRSPEPVNWTVPLDTGKTFTVTQNIRESDAALRSQSDVKAWNSSIGLPQPRSIPTPTDLAKTNVKEEILSK